MPHETISINEVAGYVGELLSGALFLLIGFIAFMIAILRRDKYARVLIWLSFWSGIYGMRLLIGSPLLIPIIPAWIRPFLPGIDVAGSYLILFFALLSWIEFSNGLLRRFLQVMALFSILIATVGTIWFFAYNDPDYLMLYNNLIASVTLLILIVIIFVKPLYDRLLNMPNRKLMGTAALLFAGEALFSNLAGFLDYSTAAVWGWLGFAILLVAMAISALEKMFANERRLMTIENDLETARKIQESVLPAAVPEMPHLQLSAAYYPMAQVAGDFYDFLCVDENRIGFFIADVSGHGIPAALIASMVRIAIQSAVNFAESPGRAIRHVAEVMSHQLRDQFLTAACLYLDLNAFRARYSAAGHPPVLYRNALRQQWEPIESNGLLISRMGTDTYPEAEIEIHSGDRFLLYSDGLTEAENKAGEQFGDKRLLQVLDDASDKSCGEMSSDLHKALAEWLNNSAEQQDDYTWILIDII